MKTIPTLVNRSILPILLLIFLTAATAANGQDSIALQKRDTIQRPDSIPKDSTLQNTTTLKDTVSFVAVPDSIIKKRFKPAAWKMDLGISPDRNKLNEEILEHQPYFGFGSRRLIIPSVIRQFHGKELIFYLLVFLFIIYALLRLTFPKYFNDLFRLFFRTTIKQRQITEQLEQTPLPSLMLNVFFIVCGGLYVAFVLQHYNLNPLDNFWLMFLYAGLGLSAIYLIKFLGLKVSGWLFNMPDAANSYIFVIFIINKMLGLFLLPFLVLLAFTQGQVYPVALTLSFCVVGALLLYRFILSYAAIRNQVRVNPFHFFLYLIAFEIAPLLLIYKGLLLFFRISA